MINTYQYYCDHVKQDSYFYFKYDMKINEWFSFHNTCYFDEEEMIKKFRELTYPSNTYCEDDEMEFLLICFYLNDNGYYIEEFPGFLEKPKPASVFSNDIRTHILSNGGASNIVTWAERRRVADSLKIVKKDMAKVEVSKGLNELFKKISNRNADFIAMSSEEKIGEINNAIENLLKIEEKWQQIDYENETCNFITNEMVTNYRNLTHCFRHASEKSLRQRESFSNNQKDFLINYGITICDIVYKNIKQT